MATEEVTLAPVPTTGPSTEPITLADAKLHLGVTGTGTDTPLTSDLIAARKNAGQLDREYLAGLRFNLSGALSADWIKIYFDPNQAALEAAFAFDLQALDATIARCA